MASFSFGFGGDDIEDDAVSVNKDQPQARPDSGPGHRNSPSSAFPVAGKPQLQPCTHSLQDMLYKLPSKIAFDTLDISLDGADFIQLPRRELWDVKLQVQAEEAEDDETTEGLGEHDVKTGIYEGGFKSWESSVDLVKVLNSEDLLGAVRQRPLRVIEVRGLPSDIQILHADDLHSLVAALLCHHWHSLVELPIPLRRVTRLCRC